MTTKEYGAQSLFDSLPFGYSVLANRVSEGITDSG